MAPHEIRSSSKCESNILDAAMNESKTDRETSCIRKEPKRSRLSKISRKLHDNPRRRKAILKDGNSTHHEEIDENNNNPQFVPVERIEDNGPEPVSPINRESSLTVLGRNDLSNNVSTDSSKEISHRGSSRPARRHTLVYTNAEVPSFCASSSRSTRFSSDSSIEAYRQHSAKVSTTPDFHTDYRSQSNKKLVNAPSKRTRLRAGSNKTYENLTSVQLQRRLLANARERSRVHALSSAFHCLRRAIPSYSPEQKLSKLTILRVAIHYINALESLLNCDGSYNMQTQFSDSVEECTAVLRTEYGRSRGKSAEY